MRKSVLLAVLCVVAFPVAADELALATVGALKLSVPSAWRKTVNESATRFANPAGDAYFDVDVGAVQTPGGLPAGVCLNNITASIGGAWTRLSIGSNPAAKKSKVETNSGNLRYVSETYVGCNGKTTWSITFHMVSTKRDSFEPLVEKITKSIQ